MRRLSDATPREWDEAYKPNLFTPAQCEDIRRRVFELQGFMINRGGFYTLGAATYQDDPLAYPAIANAFNLILESVFPDMYNALRDCLGARLSLPVGRCTRGLALPGFHIFDSSSAGMMGHPHIDEPYERVDFGVKWHSPFSFTVPIMLPSGGGGVDFWPNCTDGEIEAFFLRGTLPPAVYTPYELGKLYLHDGLTPHRIANPQDIESGEYRITLQGHGVITDGGAILYF